MVRVIIRSALLVIVMIGAALPLAVQTPAPAVAQEATVSCTQMFQQALVDTMAHCFGLTPGTACGASGAVTITMQSGQTVTGPGATALISGVATVELDAGQGDSWPLASFAVQDSFDRRKAATVLLLGPASVTFVEYAALQPGAAFTLDTSNAPLCSELPYPGLLVQSPEATLTQLHINDTDVMINGMALITARSGGTLQVNALTKETVLGQSGTVLFAGYTTSVTGEFAGEVMPYDAARVANLPVEILPDMQRIAQPGNATVTKTMNLFFEPAQEYYSTTMIDAGLPVNLFGQDASGQWAYVRSYEGYEGWMPLYVLALNTSGELPVLDETPADLIRPFGSVQGYVKANYEFNNLRAGPGEEFDIVVTVPLWTDLALYGRSADGQWLLVETLEDQQRAWLNVALVSTATPYNLDELPLPPEIVQ